MDEAFVVELCWPFGLILEKCHMKVHETDIVKMHRLSGAFLMMFFQLHRWGDS